MAAVVHHGGAGTTGAGLRSGVPSILTPLAADQPSWARQVHALGAGPAPLPFQTLTAERLADEIREAVTNPAIRQRAAEIGRRLQAEDGLGRTIELFLRYVERFGHVM
jgi:UDP:flavonoid glycosyltransferase YjiC (YdhE family)